VGACYSHRQFCSLGPLPPRTPARPDPQVPRDSKLGPCLHGKIGAFYFYQEGSRDDPAFGFFDIELSLQSIGNDTLRIEIYCVADGYQTARGVGRDHPIRISVISGGETVARAAWHFPDVIAGHADPMNFSTDVRLDGKRFAAIDSIALDKVEGLAVDGNRR
jgi:hypothetical protein